jgi:hypothetical protein
VATRGKKVSVVLAELKDATLTLRVPSSEFDFESVKKSFGKSALAQVRDDGKGLRVILREDEVIDDLHAHVLVEPDDKSFVTFRYDLVRGAHGKESKKTPKSSDFLSVVIRALSKPHLPLRGLLSGNFSLSLEAWEPVIPLPIPSPAALQGIPGSPKITGVDLSFGPGAERSPIRAFVTTYPEVKEMIVRVLLRFEAPITPGLPLRLVEEVQSALPAFVKAL